MGKRTGWSRALEVVADGKDLIGHAGSDLARQTADRVGLTDALGAVFTPGGPGWIDRGVVLTNIAVAITAGAKNVSDVEQLGLHHRGLMGTTGSDSTIITAESAKEQATGTFQGTYGHHPLAAWLANTSESLAMMLRAGNAGSNIAADLDAWLRLLGFYDQPDLARAEPATMRFRIYAVPARLASHARKRWLHLNHDWPWAAAITTAWNRLCRIPETPA